MIVIQIIIKFITCKHLCVCVLVCMCICVCMHACMCVYLNVSACVLCVCMCAYTCLCICVSMRDVLFYTIIFDIWYYITVLGDLLVNFNSYLS